MDWTGGLPTSADNADIYNNGTATVTKTGDVCSNLVLGGTTGSGTLNVSGTGGLTIGQTLFVGTNGTGTLNITGGGADAVSAGTEDVGYAGTGTMTLSDASGVNTVSGLLGLGGSTSTSSGTFNLSAGSLSVTGTVYVGDAGHGTFTQSGGTQTVTGIFDIGHAAGSVGIFNLSNGTMTVTGSEYVGDAGAGTFTQTGGTNRVTAALYLGNSGTGNGTYNLNGGSLIAPKEYVGYSGTGTLTQTGGSNTLTGSLYLGYNSGSNGTYNLNGGTLSLAALSGGSGTAAFNFGGGTLWASGPFTTTLPMTLTGSGGNATVDTAGNTVTFSGSLSGAGGLTKTDNGVLILSASNTYAGGTTVNGGTLQLGSSFALGASTGATTVSTAGLLDLHGFNLDLGALSGAGTIDNLSASGTSTLLVGIGNASSTFSGVIQSTSGAIALTKAGTGTFILSGSNTYTGLTTIGAGTLQLGDGVSNNGSVAGNITDTASMLNLPTPPPRPTTATSPAAAA